MDKFFDPIRREILRREPLSSLEECYSLVRREALRSATLNDDVEKLEAFAMLQKGKTLLFGFGDQHFKQIVAGFSRRKLCYIKENKRDLALACRLGHASFGYLKKSFPSLFKHLDISSFKCDVCELAKSHRTIFPLNLN